MLSEPATVVAASPGVLVLESGRRTACSGCSLKRGCGHHLLVSPDARLQLQTSDIASTRDLDELVPGCAVHLQVEAGQVLRLTLFFYVLPLAGLLLGTLLALLLGLAEAGTVAGALAGLLAGFCLARVALRRQGANFRVAVTNQATAAEESSS